jgi:HD-like signal output (HDOD) protein
MDTCLREQYAEVVDYAQKRNLLLIEAEESVLGVNHTDFGHWLSDSWNLPLNLTVPVLYHHAPHRTPDHYLLSCLVHMGDILARSLELGSGGDETIPAINRRAWASLKLNRPFLAQLVPEIYNQMERLPFEI